METKTDNTVEQQEANATSPRLQKAENPTPSARDIFALEERESELFGRIMSSAREQTTPLSEIHGRTMDLAVPEKVLPSNVSSPLEEKDATASEARWTGGMDGDGNPLWITLSVPERNPEEDRIVPESVLPEPIKKPQDKAKQKKQPPAPQRPGLLQSLLWPFKDHSQSAPDKNAFVHRPRPMRNFFRMLLVTAILGMFYYILSRQGWVPRLF